MPFQARTLIVDVTNENRARLGIGGGDGDPFMVDLISCGRTNPRPERAEDLSCTLEELEDLRALKDELQRVIDHLGSIEAAAKGEKKE